MEPRDEPRDTVRDRPARGLRSDGLTTIWPRRFRPDPFTLLAALIATLGAVMVLGHRLSVNTDSASFIFAATSVLRGEGFLDFGGFPFTLWPPLYPLALAAATFGVLDPLEVAGPLNALFFGTTVFVVGRYLRRRLASAFLAMWGCLATAVAAPLIYRSASVLSDPLFILLVALALIHTDGFLAERRFRTLVSAAVFSALAWQTRYIGASVPALVGPLLLFWPGAPFAERAKRTAVYSLIAGAPTALWFGRNLLVTGGLTSHNPPPGYNALPAMLRGILDLLWAWMQTNTASMALVVIPLVSILAVSARKRSFASEWRPVFVFGGFALIYILLLLLIITLLVGIALSDDGNIRERYFLPIYIPLLIAGAFVLDRVFKRERALPRHFPGSPSLRSLIPKSGGSILRPALMIVLLLGSLSQIRPDLLVIANRGDPFSQDPGIARWADSEAMRYGRDQIVSSFIYTNVGWQGQAYLYVSLGRHRRHVRVRYLGKKPEPPPLPTGAVVIWIHDMPSHDRPPYGEADLRALPGMEVVAELPDGIVFKTTE